jgi:Protein of unknown function (DUF4058)
MPLRNHTRPPFDFVPFEAVHGGWPMKMVENLFDQVPPNYFLAPQVQLGTRLEYDMAAYENDSEVAATRSLGDGATATLAPPEPTLDLECELSLQDEYEVRVYDHNRGRRLVATVEIVSPANKDRPENRRAFVAKCAALLQQEVSVSIVDIVPEMQFNLYTDLLELMGQTDPSMGEQPPAMYAATCRGDRRPRRPRMKSWSHILQFGQPLPTLPIGLADDFWISLDLEWSYEQTCKFLGITRLERA